MQVGIDISVLVEDHLTGIGNYVYNLIKFVLIEDEINIYSLLGITPLKAYFRIKELNFFDKSNTFLKAYRLPSKLFHKIFGLWQALNWPPIEYLAGNVDVFHSFDWYCPSAKKAKVVATIFDVTPLTHPEWHTPGNVQQHTRRLQAIKKNADFITTISECSKKDIVKQMGIDPQKIVVAYPGVDRQKFRPIKDKSKINKILQKYNLTPNYILSVGTIQPRKNIARLIEAVKLLNKKDQQLVLVGRRGKDSEILPKSKKIKFLNYVQNEDLVVLYNGAKVFVYPSLYEGFGMPVLEAMSCGCPVVTSNISSLPEVTGKDALLINPYKVGDIANAINKITGYQLIHYKLREKGIERAKKFTWENCARKTLNVYQKVFNSKGVKITSPLRW